MRAALWSCCVEPVVSYPLEPKSVENLDSSAVQSSGGVTENPFARAEGLLEAGYRQEALRAYQSMGEAFRAQGNRLLEAEALFGEAQVHRDSGRPSLAGKCFRAALHLFHRQGSFQKALKALSGVGSVQELQGRFPLALRTYRWILRLCLGEPLTENRFWALCNMASVLLRIDQQAEAKSKLSEAMPLVENVCPVVAPALHHLMAKIEFSLGNMFEAELHLRKAVVTARDLDISWFEGRMLSELAQFSAHFGRTWEARELLKEALLLVTREGDEGKSDEVEIRSLLNALAPKPVSYPKVDGCWTRRPSRTSGCTPWPTGPVWGHA